MWKPASTAVYNAYYVMKLLEAAGLPPGVINFVPGPGSIVVRAGIDPSGPGRRALYGQYGCVQDMWRTIGNNINRYRTYPRLVGETGGKDFVFAHVSAEIRQPPDCFDSRSL